jgi:hypothetical protein
LLLSVLTLDDARAQTSIFDPPPVRGKPAMTPADQLKLKKDLTAARDRREPNTKAKPPKVQRAHPERP